MQISDLDQIMINEVLSYQFPWRRVHFEDCIKANYLTYVLETNKTIIGHAVTSIGADECHILNISIIPEAQQQGWGSLLLKKLHADAEKQRVTAIFLEVRPTNQAGIALYRSAGFIEVGKRKHYYPSENGREDALVLKKTLHESATIPTP